MINYLNSIRIPHRLLRHAGIGLLTMLYLLSGISRAADPVYRLNPGDRLEIKVWHEEKLDTKTRVLPDGSLSFPLAGLLPAAGKTLAELALELQKRLRDYLPEPEVSVRLIAPQGNRIYVTGEVVHPGAYTMARPTDIVQALSMAGGLTPYAKKHRILVLRREASGFFTRIGFDYGDIEDGEALHTNIILKGGDTLVIP
ncbi:MAG: polysaccharide biosynthesis/export family protein [Methylococcaceae bacterium]